MNGPLVDSVQLHPAVEGAAVLGGVVAHRFGLAETGSLQPVGCDAVELKAGLDGVDGAPPITTSPRFRCAVQCVDAWSPVSNVGLTATSASNA
ncbi:MAG: hypothetical protein OQK55_03705 [Thermoanaerobaculales bacterium]|nr:hypothetical protein [Thermoanaerobaculales bacterium]